MAALAIRGISDDVYASSIIGSKYLLFLGLYLFNISNATASTFIE